MYQFIRTGTAVPELRVADPAFNGEKIVEMCDQAAARGVKILLFPELCITGYTCGDLFFQSALHRGAAEALGEICVQTAQLDMMIVLGMPIHADNQTFNCGVVLHRGNILGAVPKSGLPNKNEFYEDRWFSPAQNLVSEQMTLCGQQAPIGPHLLFECPEMPGLTIGIEVCADLWCPLPPSSRQALRGATVILNLSASNELTTKSDYRRRLIMEQSSRLVTAYLYASAGVYESTTDLVFGGHTLICENGAILAEGELLSLEPTLLTADVDIELLVNYRRTSDSFMADYADITPWRVIPVPLHPENDLPLERRWVTHPFVPASEEALSRHCEEIFAIQSMGLTRRLQASGVSRAVIAVSGGLDSTLALLCTVRAFDRLKRDRREIIGVTMPGFGTTGRTYHNALALMESLGITLWEIDIKKACEDHLAAIGYGKDSPSVVFENAQARERTQIIMDIANLVNGLVVGTGDLSELALGFTTYNGDHMSMYNVNCSIPKTLVRALTGWVARSEHLDDRSVKILLDILDTPVSPELLPPDQDGAIAQKTEDVVGPYELHDFFLYHMIRHGFAPAKILFQAEHAFSGQYDRATILKWMKLFYRRFFSQQFKRSCAPDGPKVGSVALSPRGDWRMPSDASVNLWMRELERCNPESGCEKENLND